MSADHPHVVALVGSPRRHGNTHFAAGIAVEELRQRGVTCDFVLLSDIPFRLSDPDENEDAEAQVHVEKLVDEVWRADGLILATPIYFSNVSAQMKAFMDATNDRYLRRDWLRPKAIGLMAIGGQGGFRATIESMRRYLHHVAPDGPAIIVATGRADAAGEAERSEDVQEAARAMAAEMASVLLA